MILRHAFIPVDNQRLANLCGTVDHNLRRIEQGLDVKISRRNGSFRLEGAKPAAERAAMLLQSLYEQAARPIEPESLDLQLAQLRSGGGLSDNPGPTGVSLARTSLQAAGSLHAAAPGDSDAASEPELVLRTRRSDLTGRTPNQMLYLRHILGHDLTLGIGPAGTGKTFLAVACAVDALARNAVQRIVLTRPAVEAGERLGFLPGDLTQKVDPYLRPLYDALHDLMGFDRVTKAFEKGLLEIAPLAFMRGRTLSHAFVILDEAQNTTREQMKMFLTRIGFGSKVVVTGDVSQIDLPRGTDSGLIEAERVLRRVRGVATTHFTSVDIVRHPLVQRIVEAYDADQSGSLSPP